MDHSVHRKKIRSSCDGHISSLNRSIKGIERFSILFENTHKKICKENEMHWLDQLARNNFGYLCRFSIKFPKVIRQTNTGNLHLKKFWLFAVINFTLNMKNSRIFVGDAIPLREPDFTQ